MAETEEKLKSFLMRVKEKNEKADLKLNIRKKNKILRGWHPVPSLQSKQKVKIWKQWQIFFLSSKITTDGDCSHEIKKRLPLGRKPMINLDCVLKSRDISLPTKVHLVNAMVFPVVMYGCTEGNGNPLQCS